MNDPEQGADAPRTGASGGTDDGVTVERPLSSGRATTPAGTQRSSAAQEDARTVPAMGTRKRRKRRRGRKVFARDADGRIAGGGTEAVFRIVSTPVPQGADDGSTANEREPASVQRDPGGGNSIAPSPRQAGQPSQTVAAAALSREKPGAGEARPAAQAPQASSRQGDLPVYAALDLGTNNCRLLVAVPTRPGQFRVIDAFSRIVRLGEGLSGSGRLGEPAMNRAVEALKVCADKLRSRRVRKARLIATEACRSAANGAEFIARVEAEAGIALEIIDRKTEARLAVSGCGSLVERGTGGVVLFDIGGGSSEIALIDVSRHRTPRLANHIVSWTSLPVGVVSLAERFGGRDVTPEVFGAMVDDVSAMIERFDERGRLAHVPRDQVHLLGTSGTVTTLAGVHLGLERYDRRRVDGLWMDNASVDAMIATLMGWDFQARVANPCIGADRADLVLAGCAILEAIRRHWPTERLRVADRGLREGMLSELMADDGAWRRFRRRSAGA